jgi:hypothetical protein
MRGIDTMNNNSSTDEKDNDIDINDNSDIITQIKNDADKSLIEINIPSQQTESIKKIVSDNILTDKMIQENISKYIQNMSEATIRRVVSTTIKQQSSEIEKETNDVSDRLTKMKKDIADLDLDMRLKFNNFKNLVLDNDKVESDPKIVINKSNGYFNNSINTESAINEILDKSKDNNENKYVIINNIKYNGLEIANALRLLEEEKQRKDFKEAIINSSSDLNNIENYKVVSKIREILELQGKKLSWLQEQTKIPKSTFNSIVNGVNSISLENGFRISTVLQQKIEDIFTFKINE